MAVLLDFRKPEVTILESAVSTSGKYFIFFGYHYEAGHTCWVVGSSNKTSGKIVMRHYNDGIQGCFAPRAQAVQCWEDFKTKMTAKKEHEDEEDERSANLASWFERAKSN